MLHALKTQGSETSKSWFAFFQMSPARVPLEPVSSYSPLAMRARICLEWPLVSTPRVIALELIATKSTQVSLALLNKIPILL